MTCIPLHKTWQMNLLWLNTMDKGLKALAFTISEITHTAFLKTHFCLESFFLFVPRAPEISTSKFSGVLNPMAKVCKFQHSLFLRFSTAFSQNTCFSLEIGFHSFLELQKPQLVCFWGRWTQWQRFESSSIHHFWDTPQHVSQNTCFSLESWLSFIPRASETSTSKFLGALNTMAKVWKL